MKPQPSLPSLTDIQLRVACIESATCVVESLAGHCIEKHFELDDLGKSAIEYLKSAWKDDAARRT